MDWHDEDGLIAQFTFDDMDSQFAEGEPEFAPSQHGQAAALDGRRHVSAGDVANFGYFDKFSITCWVSPDRNLGTIISRMEDVLHGSGYSIRLIDGRIEVDLVKRWLDDSIRIETANSIIPLGQWSHVAVTYDGSRVADGIQVFVNGQSVPLKTNLDYINQSFATDAPLRIGAGHGPEERFSGQIDEVRVYGRVLTAGEIAIISEPATLAEILQAASQDRTQRQEQKLFAWYVQTHADQDARTAIVQQKKLNGEVEAFKESLPTVMVMQELAERRPTFVLTRGEYDKPAAEVFPGIPETVDFIETPIGNRLDFANWLIDPRNPLTARVAVNRIWQQLFGTGLVKTTEDFGSQGELPSHPLLLDWLATEFIRLDWDVKQLQKLIVMSAVYQQTSFISPEFMQADPENRLLARAPRLRLSARMLRDQALFVSGLLHEQVGGPSVKPYQPAGLWKEIATTTNYEQSTGSDLYRRSLYTYWKRTVAPPNMAVFDAAGREACVVRASRTNTPLQALVTMNDVTFLEAARGLAQRCIRESTSSTKGRLQDAFRLATCRYPDDGELEILTSAYGRHLQHYAQNSVEAEQLLSHGELKADPTVNRADLAALTMIAATILNMDEVINRE